MNTTLQRWGNSQGVRLPKALVDGLGAKVGTPVMPDHPHLGVNALHVMQNGGN
jgi:hypothetical protein